MAAGRREYYEEDDVEPDNYRTEYSEPIPKRRSREERELEETKERAESYEEAPLTRRASPRRGTNALVNDYDDEYYDDDDIDYYYDEYYDDDNNDDYGGDGGYREPESGGNYWHNPTASVDREVMPRSRQRPGSRPQQQPRPTSRRQSRRTDMQSSSLGPSPPVRGLYSKLFWFGFESDETDSNGADPTMFGGTKGKFNGMAFVNDGGLFMPDDQRRRRRRSRPRYRDDDEEEEWWDEEDVDPRDDIQQRRRRDVVVGEKDVVALDDDDHNDERINDGQKASIGKPKSSYITPPWDPPMIRFSPPPSSGYRTRSPQKPEAAPEPRRRQRRSRRYEEKIRRRREYNDDYGYDDEEEDWKKPITDWFTDKDNDGGRGYERPRGRDKRSRRRQDESIWSPFQALDVFLGVDRDRLENKAQAYDRQMGLNPKFSSADADSNSRGAPPGSRRRRGYAYKYNDDKRERDQDPVVAAPSIPGDLDREEEIVIDATVEPGGPDINGSRKGSEAETDDRYTDGRSEKKELTWEERALAMERVPPVGIPAWGPSGELGMDARAKAISDALEDVQDAKAKVRSFEDRVEQAREDLSITRINAELERKRLERNGGDSRRAREELRKMEQDTARVSRTFRYAQLKLSSAQEELDDVEKRHWAVLSCCNSTQVENNMLDALRELEETEPAARRVKVDPDLMEEEGDDEDD